MKASICMATYNRDLTVLRQVFESIFAQKPPFDFEVIVCDDGTHLPDGRPSAKVEALCQEYPIEYHRISREPGFQNPCVPRNVTYRAARGDIIIAQSDEVVHQSHDTIETLVRELEQQPGKFIIATVNACGPDGKPWSVYTGTARQKPWMFLGAVWREHVYAVGGNDEDFRYCPGFDDEWFARCLQRGLGLTPFYSIAAVGHHLYHPPSSTKETSEPNRILGEEKTREAERTGVWCSSGGPWPIDDTVAPYSPEPPELEITSVVVCVEYDDFLAITLPLNKRHFHRTLVVTSPEDKRTQEAAKREGCECLVTDFFYVCGSAFNKGMAMEQAFEALGREGWFCYWDADIVMPDDIFDDYDEQYLYCPFRRILDDPSKYAYDLVWQNLPRNPQQYEFPGYFHLFHASAAGPPPWYSTHWKHAGGCDSDFEAMYRAKNALRRPNFEVLHLGPVAAANGASITRVNSNWCGRTTPRLDTGKTPAKAAERTNQVSAMVGKRKTMGIAALSEERNGNIPRRMSFLWAGRMSWLRWLCLDTFMRQNPHWDVRLYMPTTDTPPKYWPGTTDDDHAYAGPDYRDQLPGKVTRHYFDPPPGIAAPQLCGWFRWQVLSRGGGFFADMDFLWLKPLEDVWRQIRNNDAMFCLESGYMAVGFMASCPNCEVFQDIAAFLPPTTNSEHQHFGVDGLYRFFGVGHRGQPVGPQVMTAARQRYPQVQIVELPDFTVYPYDWSEIDKIWRGVEAVDERSIALHWFGGAQLSREYSHKTTPENWRHTRNTMHNYLERVL